MRNVGPPTKAWRFLTRILELGKSPYPSCNSAPLIIPIWLTDSTRPPGAEQVPRPLVPTRIVTHKSWAGDPWGLAEHSYGDKAIVYSHFLCISSVFLEAAAPLSLESKRLRPGSGKHPCSVPTGSSSRADTPQTSGALTPPLSAPKEGRHCQ